MIRSSFAAIACWLVWGALSTAPARSEECGRNSQECAAYHVSRREYSQAIPYLEQTLEGSPRSVKVLNLLGISLTASGQVEKANVQFKKALGLQPNFFPAEKNLAVNEFNSGRRSEAKGHFQNVLRYAPDDEVANLYLGEIFFMEKQCAAALPHYDRSRGRIVNSPDLIFRYAHCSLDQKRAAPAATMLSLLPAGDALSQFRAGQMLAQAGVFKEAAEHFGLSRPGYPEPNIAGYNQVLMLFKSGDYPAATRVGQELIAQGYKQSDLYSLVSEAYQKNDQIKEAYDVLRKATQINPREESNYLDLAALCLDYENYDLGLEISDIGLRNIPNSDRLYLQRGVMRAMKGQVAESEKDFEMARSLAPQKTLPYVALGIAWMQLGEIQKAVEELQKQAQRNPEDFLVHYLLGEALLRSGPPPGSDVESGAIRAFETSVRLNPNFVHSRAGLGKLLLRRGELDRAIGELEKAVEIDPAETAPVFQLANAYRRKGDTARADQTMARVSQLHEQAREDSMGKALKRIVKEAAPGFTVTRNKP